MLTEMTNMAIDFEEEKLHKRVAMIQLAREAQKRILNKKREEERANLEVKLPEVDYEERDSPPLTSLGAMINAPNPLIDPVTDTNNLQIKLSLASLYNDLN